MATVLPVSGNVEARIRSLVTEIFEPTDFSAITLTPPLKTKSAAFLVLAHTEIEYAIEQECLIIAGMLSGAVEPVTAMLAWGFVSLKADGTIGKAKENKHPLVALTDLYKHVVNSNNGIKTKDIEALLIPLGIDLRTLNTDISALHTFGSRRGDLAHQPVSKWTTPDLPSVHINDGIQAGRSADQIIIAIRKGHSKIVHAPSRPLRITRRVRRKIASFFQDISLRIDAN